MQAISYTSSFCTQTDAHSVHKMNNKVK